MSNNTAWQRDSTGAYVEFATGTANIEVSFNFDQLLNTGEIIRSVTAETDLTLDSVFPFWKQQTAVDRYNLAVVKFANLDQTGLYPVTITVTTDQNRVYQQQFRVKVV